MSEMIRVDYEFITTIRKELKLNYYAIQLSWNEMKKKGVVAANYPHLCDIELTERYLVQHITRRPFNRLKAEALHCVLNYEKTKLESDGIQVISKWQFEDLILNEKSSEFLLFEFKLSQQPRPLTALRIEKFSTAEGYKYLLSGCSYTTEGKKGFEFVGESTFFNRVSNEFVTNFQAEEVSNRKNRIRGNTHFYVPSKLEPVSFGYYFDVASAEVEFLLVDSMSDLMPDLVKKEIAKQGTVVSAENGSNSGFISYDNLTPEIVSALLESEYIGYLKGLSEKCRKLL